jgi:Contractile injection system tape measure protein
MANQHHVIKRQLLQVTVQEAASAFGLQQRLSRLAHSRLMPLIAGHCSELSSPDVIHRIDSLELDLGELPLKGLEEALIKKFDTEFPRKLGEAIGQESAGRPQEARTTAYLELFTCFIQSGTLPWWADTSETGLLEKSVIWLSARAPGAFKPFVTDFLTRQNYRKRLIQHLSNSALVTLAGLCSPALGPFAGGVFADLSTVFLSVDGLNKLTAQRLRFEIWSAILSALSFCGAAAADRAGFIRNLLLCIASGSRITRSLLLERMLQAIERLADAKHLFSNELPAILEALREPEAISETHPQPDAGSLSELEASVNTGFSDSDEAYIKNAGLVILWPFLVLFFERLGLLAQRRFRDADATHRAVRLLQYLADPQQEPPPEYLLVLNKVLCGMPVDEVFDFGLPLTEREIEECDSLLTAAIDHAPILHNMSAAGFRTAFLLRRGQLSTRDEAWLLRVERETYDVVLDQFPWSIAWVKLPWMEDPMQVEW